MLSQSYNERIRLRIRIYVFEIFFRKLNPNSGIWDKPISVFEEEGVGITDSCLALRAKPCYATREYPLTEMKKYGIIEVYSKRKSYRMLYGKRD